MDIYEEIGKVLFKIGQDIDIHKMPDGNLILDISYDDYIEEIVSLFDDYVDSLTIEE
jgi:hypothetical protein